MNTISRAAFSAGMIPLFILLATGSSSATSRIVSWGYYWPANNPLVPVSPPPQLPDALAVAGGAGHSLALRSNGTVAAWGDNSYGQVNVPSGLNNVIALAAGEYHSLALKADGRVVAWGRNDQGQTSVPLDLTNAVAIAGGWFHSLALRDDGTVVAWGGTADWGGTGETSVPQGLNNVVAIASCNAHCLALKGDGTVVGWGSNLYGEGNLPPDLNNIVAIAAGSFHNVALRADGTLIAWGDDMFGELDIPAGLTNAAAVACGGNHSLVLGDDDSVSAWGAGEIVDLSTGADFGQSIVPGNLTNVAAVSAGYFHSLALMRDGPPLLSDPPIGRTVCYGSTAWLRIGASGAQPLSYQWQFNGTNLAGATNPTLDLPNVQLGQSGPYSLAVSNRFGLTLSSNITLTVAPAFITAQPQSYVTVVGGAVTFTVAASGVGPFGYQWQLNGVDLPGATNSVLVVTNVQVSQAGTYRVIVSNAVGAVTSAPGILSLTQVVAWGGVFPVTNVPPGLTNVVSLNGGLYHCVALKDNGSVVAWGGDNYYGENNVPVNLTNAIAVSAGDNFTLALRADRTVVAWGWNGFGQTDVPSGLSNVVAISAATVHSLALKADGTVVAWGAEPAPAGMSNLVAIAAARDYSLGLKADGTVVAWGGARAIPPDLTNVVAIAAGRGHSVALKADGSVVAWGDNSWLQTNVPADLTNAVAIAAGEYHSLGLRTDGTIVAWGDAVDFNVWPPIPPNTTCPFDYGQCRIPSGLTNVTGIGAGFYSSMAVVQAGPPILTADLVNTVVIYGSTVFLRPGVYGAGPLSYQWQCNGTNIPGATSSTLTIQNIHYEQAGLYSVVISNTFGTISSSQVTLGIIPFVITADPQDQFTFRGSTVQLTVAASSQLPLSYQWQFNGQDLDGATNSTLVLANVQSNQSGKYRALIRNALATLTTHEATVEVGQVIAWGDDSYGKTDLPPGLTNIVTVAAGDNHSLALRADGTVVAWGMSWHGETNVPPSLTNAVAISGGSWHSLALRADGTVFGWGMNSEGEVSVPWGLTNVIAVAAGGNHSLALRADGRVVAWGNNYWGETSVPPGLSDVVAIAAGLDCSFALRADGRVVAWGNNDWGQMNIPPGLSNVVAIASGWQHCLALRSDGTMVVWGANYQGATNMPPGITDVIAISAGGHHCDALRADRTIVSWPYNSPPWFATNIVVAAAGASHEVAVVDSLWPLVIPLGPPRSSKSLQTQQAVRVFNRSPFTFPAVRVTIQNLPRDATVRNASGSDLLGQPYILSDRPLGPGASVDVVIDYLTQSGSFPRVLLVGEVTAAPVFVPITRSAWRNGMFLIEVDSLFNRNYNIQYSPDLMGWRTVYPAISGTGSRIEWADNGPPGTVTFPTSQPARFYRVMLAP